MIRCIAILAAASIGLGSLFGCGLYESPPSLEEVGTCGICGPCALGVINCATNSCEFEGPWQGVLSGEMACRDIVVVKAGASDEQGGRLGEPVGSIERALELATERDASAIALIEDGQWQEEVVLGSGLTLIGGVDESLQPIDSRPRLIWEADEEQVTALLVDGVSQRVDIVGLSIEGRGGVTNYGIRVVDSGQVVLRDLHVLAGPGGDGGDGEDGDDGASGSVGGDGGAPSAWSQGSGGVNQACPAANGGDGGHGAMADMDPAQRGEDSPGGAAGRWGDGADGFSVDDGSRGGVGGESYLEQGLWKRGAPGGDGEVGEHGIGGGGGGGGNVGDTGAGGGGGGGGAGGCGGEGGQGGENGGSSIGVLVQSSELQIFNSEIVSSTGGDAGVGGEGGAGGQGMPGGAGASGVETGQDGSDGGHGGQGGAGGDGGDGRGGNSYSLLCGENTNIEINKVLLEHDEGGLQPQGQADSSTGRGCNH